MAFSASFADMIVEALAPLGNITVKRIFSSGGVYCDGTLLGIASDDVLYLKADATTQSAFANEGCRQFIAQAQTRAMAMPYWSVPERLYDETDELVEWARTSLEVARRANAARPDRASGKPARAAKARRRDKA